MAIGHDIRWTLEDSWRAYGRYFCVVDTESLDLYWPKYDRFREYRRRLYGARRTDRYVTFQDWLAMYTGQAFEGSVPEHVLDERA